MSRAEALPDWVVLDDPLGSSLSDELPPRTRHAVNSARHRAKMVRALARWRSGPCEKCGDRKGKREMAHLTPTGLNGAGRGVERRYYDITRNPGCYGRLCVPCHRTIDKPGHPRLVRTQLPFADDPPRWQCST